MLWIESQFRHMESWMKKRSEFLAGDLIRREDIDDGFVGIAELRASDEWTEVLTTESWVRVRSATHVDVCRRDVESWSKRLSDLEKLKQKLFDEILRTQSELSWAVDRLGVALCDNAPRLTTAKPEAA